MNHSLFNQAFVLLNSRYLTEEGVDYYSLMESDPFFYRNIRNRCLANDLGGYLQAIDLFSEHLASNQKHGLSYQYRAAAHYRLGDDSKALDDINLAISLHPESAFSYNLRSAISYRIRGNMPNLSCDSDDTFKDVCKAIEFDKLFPIAYISRAFLYLNKKMPDLAELDIEQAIKLDPKNEQCYYCRSQFRVSLNDISGALNDLNYTIELDPKHILAYLMRGDIFELLGDFESAISDYTLVLQIDPIKLNGYIYRGQAKSKFKDYTGAIMDLSKAMDIWPNEYARPILLECLRLKKGKTAKERRLEKFYKEHSYEKGT